MLSLRSADERQRKEALEQLCAGAWYPLYVFARRRGLAAEDAADATQSLFAQLLERGDLEQVERSKGSLRSYLRAALTHSIADTRDREHALKRGAGAPKISIDTLDAERRLACEPATDEDPARAFERAWATELVARALKVLRAEYDAGGDARTFDVLHGALVGDSERGAHARHAFELGSSEGAVRVALHRLRRRCRELIELEVRQTLADPAELSSELAALFEALRPPSAAHQRPAKSG